MVASNHQVQQLLLSRSNNVFDSQYAYSSVLEKLCWV